jgi:HK97 family phage major capsid protein
LSNLALKESVDALASATAETLGAMQGKIKHLERESDRFSAFMRRPGVLSAANDNVPGDIHAEREALGVLARTGDESKLSDIRAAMQVGSDPHGGYSVFPALSDTMTRKLFDQSPMRRIARVVKMTNGSEWWEPIDKDEPGATWVGEHTARPETDTPDMAMLTVPCLEQYALQRVTQRLLDDTSFPLGEWIEGKIIDKFARAEGTAFIHGTGIVDPRGLLTYPAVTTNDGSRAWGSLQYIASGGASSITADGLKDTVWSVRAPYRQGAVWLMNSNTANKIDKLKDSTGDYLWRTGMSAGSPSSLCGYPVEFAEDMPDVDAGSLSIAFGNFKLGYVIVEKQGIKFLRDPFSARPHTLFYAYRRVGGALANSEAIKLVKTTT